MKTYLFLACVIGLKGLAASASAAEITELDYHRRNIHFGNISEYGGEIESALPKRENAFFTLNLSENYLDDSCVGTLLEKLHSHVDRIKVLDLSNNRVGVDGLKALASLLMKKTFQWLVVPTNRLDAGDLATLVHHLKPSAERSALTGEAEVDANEIISRWVSKVIWLPRTYDFDLVPLPRHSREAHKSYYSTRVHP